MFLDAKDFSSGEVIAKMKGQVLRLVKLINDLLDTTGIAEGRFKIQAKGFDLSDLVQEVVEMMQHTTQVHLLQLEMNALPLFHGDRDRLEQVLTNLIGNAIKYAPDSKEIIISMKAGKKGIKICVQDFGKGLSENAQAKIFDRFYRNDDMAAQTFPGLGLGLYIAAEIARQHGGYISVQSKTGEGARFCLHLPLP